LKGSGRPILFFYILAGYVLLQFIWWGWLIADLNKEIYLLKTEVNLLSGETSQEIMDKGNQLLESLHRKWIMVLAEGLVFFILLTAGIIITRNSFLKATRLSETQKNFLLATGHEFKTPLSALRLQLETLKNRELEKSKQQEILNMGIRETERLGKLIDNVLLAAQLETGKIHFNPQKFDLSSHVKSLVDILSLNNPDLRIEKKISEGIFISGDEVLFPSITRNLLENAEKYGQGNAIEVTLHKEENRVFLEISDRGPGIPEEEKSRIFDKFYRIGNEETRTHKGTGLGLFIAKYLSKLHEGHLWVRDNSPKGSTFVLSINEYQGRK
jgi:signal transduction histidine kinase